MKLKHKKLIYESYLKYAHLSEVCPKVPRLYYLMGLAALRYRIENRAGIIYYRFPGSISIDMGTYTRNYNSFKVMRNLNLGNSGTWEIGVRIINDESAILPKKSESYSYGDGYSFYYYVFQ